MQKNHWYMNSKNYNRMEHSKEILFFKHCNGQTTPEEDSLIREILSCSEESREEMEAVKKVTLQTVPFKHMCRDGSSAVHISDCACV